MATDAPDTWVSLPDVSVQLVDDAGDIVTEEHMPGEIGMQKPTVFWSTGAIPKRPLPALRQVGFVPGISVWSRMVISESWGVLRSISSNRGATSSPLWRSRTTACPPDIVGGGGGFGRTWGEAVAAVVSLTAGAEMTVDSLKAWCEGKLSGYKIPKSCWSLKRCLAMRWEGHETRAEPPV